jgi:HD superfamily phosphohydrolase
MARKYKHEIRDPIHVFIYLDTDERKVLDSKALQRLRNIHQLALTYLVYPGATHRRFEHSLGVMELASRVFDVITASPNVHEKARDIIPGEDQKMYWRRVLRMAALCHDIGHLPFSHAAEKDLLPDGWDHERLTAEIIRSSKMQKEIWDKMIVPLKVEDIIKVALGPKKIKENFSDWETILSEIIVGDTFGVDRMDYLLRDSLHTGVAYGKFDHYRLIDTLRILPKGGAKDDSEEPTLGLDIGGLKSAEALLWARYFMFSQVYCHSVRRIHDIHLKDFLESWLENGKFPVTIEEYLGMTDNDVLVELRKAAQDSNHPGHLHAKRIIKRDHFRLLYVRNPNDLNINPNASEAVYEAARKKFGNNFVRHDEYKQKGGSQYFPVRCKDGRILQSVELSDTLSKIPVVSTDFVFIDKDHLQSAQQWLEVKLTEIITPEKESEE